MQVEKGSVALHTTEKYISESLQELGVANFVKYYH